MMNDQSGNRLFPEKPGMLFQHQEQGIAQSVAGNDLAHAHGENPGPIGHIQGEGEDAGHDKGIEKHRGQGSQPALTKTGGAQGCREGGECAEEDIQDAAAQAKGDADDVGDEAADGQAGDRRRAMSGYGHPDTGQFAFVCRCRLAAGRPPAVHGSFAAGDGFVSAASAGS